jgi:acyl phosphate:glycerol-3-phosphate acyltransferase
MDSRLLIIALVAYLIGSIPFGYILVKLFLKQDIRQTGSGNIGATNVARSGKNGLAIATLLLDTGKGFLAVWAAKAYWDSTQQLTEYFGSTPLLPLSCAALFSILGHCFPIWLKFRGGKGVATAIGAFAAVSWLGALAAFLVFLLVFGVSRYVSLGSILGSAAFPFFFYRLHPFSRDEPTSYMPLIIAASLLIILKHHGNIRRLIAGTEPKFGTKAIGTTDPIQTEKSI